MDKDLHHVGDRELLHTLRLIETPETIHSRSPRQVVEAISTILNRAKPSIIDYLEMKNHLDLTESVLVLMKAYSTTARGVKNQGAGPGFYSLQYLYQIMGFYNHQVKSLTLEIRNEIKKESFSMEEEELLAIHLERVERQWLPCPHHIKQKWMEDLSDAIYHLCSDPVKHGFLLKPLPREIE